MDAPAQPPPFPQLAPARSPLIAAEAGNPEPYWLDALATAPALASATLVEAEGAAFTICVRTLELPGLYAALPEYCTLIECDPVARPAVAHVAAPPERATAAQPEIEAAPSRTVAVPVATPAGPVTLAVNVTDCPAVDGFNDDVTATLALAFTTCEMGEDVPA